MNFRAIYKWLGLCVCALALTACSDAGGSLSGSLDNYYRLDFEQARARLYSSELALEFVASDGQVPVRVSLHHPDGVFKTGTYDLVKHGDITGQRGDSRIPRFLSGTLEIERFSARDGDEIEASFEATFQTGRDKSTLSGEILTHLEVVDAPRGYGDDAGGADGGDAQDGDAESADIIEDAGEEDAN